MVEIVKSEGQTWPILRSEGYPSEPRYDLSYDFGCFEANSGGVYKTNKPPREVTKLLCSEGFEVDVSAVPDKKLRDLIGQCLSLEPRRRPDITGFLLHPFFITTGIGPLSF